jgi:hypothetical protein
MTKTPLLLAFFFPFATKLLLAEGTMEKYYCLVD